MGPRPSVEQENGLERCAQGISIEVQAVRSTVTWTRNSQFTRDLSMVRPLIFPKRMPADTVYLPYVKGSWEKLAGWYESESRSNASYVSLTGSSRN